MNLLGRVRRTRLVDGFGQRLREGAATPPRARLDPGRGGFVAMAVVAVLVTVGVGCWVLASRPHRLPVAMSNQSPLPASAAAGGSLASPLSTHPASSSGTTMLVIDVVGKVRHPGVYRLPPGSRVDDAVAAAGGVLAGVDPVSVNLARKLADGEQLVIGVTAPVGAPASEGGSAADPGGTGTGSSLIDLNSATVTQLDALPGVGPVLAQHIVDWRTQHGRFDSIDQLQSVSGIGDAKFAMIQPLVTVG